MCAPELDRSDEAENNKPNGHLREQHQRRLRWALRRNPLGRQVWKREPYAWRIDDEHERGERRLPRRFQQRRRATKERNSNS